MTAASYSGGGGRVSAAVRVNGELRSIATKFPADAVCPIYSITKTLTAIWVLRLVETGSLRLVDAARQWLPDVSIPTAVTLTHLLRHRSGLRDYGPVPEQYEPVRAQPDRPWPRQQFLDAVLAPGMLYAPGEGFSYSNVGYMLRTDIVERVTGQTCAEVLVQQTSSRARSAATFALLRSRARLARTLSPPVSTRIRSSRKGVSARPRMPPASASDSAV